MNSPLSFICNNRIVRAEANPSMIALDYLRRTEHLTGVKEGCREGDCGACTILVGHLTNSHLSYITVNSCLMPLGTAGGKHIVTIEGLNQKDLNPLQRMIIEEGATQCGFCTPGIIISLTGYLMSAPAFVYEDALDFLGGNICRCTGYVSIKRAVKRIIDFINGQQHDNNRISFLIRAGILPEYFNDIRYQLQGIAEEIIPAVSVTAADGYLIAGGTDLFVQKEHELLETANYFLENKPVIEISDNKIIINATATVSDIRKSEIMNHHLPGIKDYLSLFGSEPIRNKATLGGNICNASPSADLVSIFLALDSTLVIEKNGSTREVLLRNFFKAYKITDLEPGEIIKELHFKVPSPAALFNFEKVSRRINLDIACVNTSVFLETEDNIITRIQLSAGGVYPIPLFLSHTAEFLKGKILSYKTINEASEIAAQEISPIDDVRGSADYKRLLLKQLFLSHFIKLFPDIMSEEEVL